MIKPVHPNENIGSTTRDERARPLDEVLAAGGVGASSNLLGWDKQPSLNFAAGWFVGSEGDEGQHLREVTGWPFSVYRKTVAVGGCDIVLAHGIQDRRDAEALAALLNGRV